MEERHQVRLERVLVEFDRLGVGRQIDYDRHHLYSIITHSTAIEGPTITCPENTAMFDDGSSPSGKPVVERLMNFGLKRAYEVAMGLAQTRTKLTLPLLKALSSLVMRNTGALHRTAGGEHDEARGDPRLQNVSAGRGDRSSLPWEKVEARTNDFVAWLNGRLEGMDSMAAPDIYDLSFDAHFRLVTIHPWPDGNGRVARLATDLVHMVGGVAPTIVRSDHKVRYIESLRAS